MVEVILVAWFPKINPGITNKGQTKKPRIEKTNAITAFVLMKPIPPF